MRIDEPCTRSVDEVARLLAEERTEFKRIAPCPVRLQEAPASSAAVVK